MGKTTQTKNFISKKLKGAVVVLPLVRMHWLLWGASGCWEKEGKCVCVSGPWELRLPLVKEGNLGVSGRT